MPTRLCASRALRAFAPYVADAPYNNELCSGRMNIALDNVITFTIKVLSKNICLVSESYI